MRKAPRGGGALCSSCKAQRESDPETGRAVGKRPVVGVRARRPSQVAAVATRSRHGGNPRKDKRAALMSASAAATRSQTRPG